MNKSTYKLLPTQVDMESTSLSPLRTWMRESPSWPKSSWNTAWPPSAPRWSRRRLLSTTRYHQDQNQGPEELLVLSFSSEMVSEFVQENSIFSYKISNLVFFFKVLPQVRVHSGGADGAGVLGTSSNCLFMNSPDHLITFSSPLLMWNHRSCC